ncbi:MAG TPA: oligosaccharide flippase family protein [Acidimicrobiales bacterium]|nr:oligosaccharide flippase family protein [Acidimicrobiales bacterium]
MRVPRLGARRPSVTAVAGPVGRRALLTLLDQGFSSISNFAVVVVVARIAGATGLGGFSFAYAGWLILAALHRSLITDPMMIEGDHRSDVARGAARGLAAELVLGGAGAAFFAAAGAVLLLAGQHAFGIAMVALAPWLPVLVVQDYWRWAGFMQARPGSALVNDTVFNCVQGAAFGLLLVAHVHSVVVVIAAWGLGGAVGALAGLWQFRVTPSLAGGLALLRTRWSLSKWLAGTSLANWGSSQAYMLLAGAILGPASLGGLKAAQTLVTGPALVLIQAGGGIGTPEATRAYAEQGWTSLTRVARAVGGLSVVSLGLGTLVVAVWGRPLLSLIYGTHFAHLQLVAVLIGVSNVVRGLSVGPILVLKATRNTRYLFHAVVVTLVASVLSVAALAPLYGVNGAAASTIVASVFMAASYLWFQHKVRRSRTGPSLDADTSSGPRTVPATLPSG